MRRFYVLRHCRTEFNEREIVQGACDSPLSNRGKSQADDIGRMLSEVHFDHVFTGSQGRHVETARRILRENHKTGPLSPIPMPGLNEHDLGAFDQKEEALLYDVSSRLYEKYHHLAEGSVSTKNLLLHHDISMVELAGIFHDMDGTGQTESVEEIRNRSLSSMKEICAMTEEDSCNLIVSSGGTLAILLNSLTGQEKEGCVMRHGECMVLVEDGAHFEKVGAYQMG